MPRKPKYPPAEGKTSTAQKTAMDEYRKSRGGVRNIQKTFGATYSKQEGDRIGAALDRANISTAQILRAVSAWIESGAQPEAVKAIPEAAAEYERQNAAIRQAEREAHAAQSAPAPQPAERPAGPADPAPADSPQE